jgi:hypothetical protein
MNINRLAVPANSSGDSQRRVSVSASRIGSSLPEITRSRSLRSAVAVALCAAAFSATASALNVTWNPNPETNIASYQLRYGTSPGAYSNTIAAGLSTSAAVSGLQEGATYYFAVTATNQAGLQSAPSAEISYQVPVASTTPTPPSIPLISSAGWTLKYASSEETQDEDGRAINAIDGNPNTYWISRWLNNTAAPPHDLEIDTGTAQSIQGFHYLPRQDQYNIGNIGDYEFYVSMDGVNWGAPVASGTFTNTKTEKEVLFPSKTGRYVRLRAFTDLDGGSLNGGILCCVAELKLLQGSANPTPVNQAPVAAAQSVTTAESTPLSIMLSASDADGNALTYTIVNGPAKGTLSGTTPNLTYSPGAGFSGADSFTFRASDGVANSNTATVSITVTPAPPPPPPSNIGPVFILNPINRPAGSEEKPYAGGTLAATATDPDAGDSITYSKVDGPEWLAISADGTLSGTPPVGSAGTNRFTVRATDKAGASGDSVLLIEISSADLPLPWQVADLGKTGLTNQASYESGRFTLRGTGLLAGTSDCGSYVWQTLSGDGEITARLTTPGDTDRRSKMGVMIRDSLASNSKHVFMGMDGGGGLCWMRRNNTGGSTSITTMKGTVTPPNVWLRLVRKGKTVSAYSSANGLKWTLVGSQTTTMAVNCQIGLSVSSGGAAVSTETFSDVIAKP